MNKIPDDKILKKYSREMYDIIKQLELILKLENECDKYDDDIETQGAFIKWVSAKRGLEEKLNKVLNDINKKQ